MKHVQDKNCYCCNGNDNYNSASSHGLRIKHIVHTHTYTDSYTSVDIDSNHEYILLPALLHKHR